MAVSYLKKAAKSSATGEDDTRAYVEYKGINMENNSMPNRHSKLRFRSMAWHQEGNWHWSIVFTARNLSRTPTWARCDVFGYQHLNITNAVQRLTMATCKLYKFIARLENSKDTKQWN